MSKRNMNGEGVVYWRESTQRFCIQVTEHAKRKTFYYYLQTSKTTGVKETKTEGKRNALKLLREIKRKQEDGVRLTQSTMPLAEYLTSWLEQIRPTVREKTYGDYESIVRVHLIPRLGHIRLNKLQPEHISRAWGNMLTEGKTATLIEHCHNRLSRALNDAKARRLIVVNPVSDVKKPSKSKRRMTPLDSVPELQRYLDENGEEKARWVSEINRVLEEAKRIDLERAVRHSSGYLPIIYTALETGMRRNELLALEWKDVDLVNGKIHVTKSLRVSKGGAVSYEEPKTNSGRRSVKMPPELTQFLTKQWEVQQLDVQYGDYAGQYKVNRNTPVFIYQGTGKRIMPDAVTHTFIQIVRNVDLPNVRFHDCRHTHARECFRNNIHPSIVQARLGHANVAITLDLYTAFIPALDDALAENFSLGITVDLS